MNQYENHHNYRRRHAHRNRKHFLRYLPVVFLFILLTGVITCGIFVIRKQLKNGQLPPEASVSFSGQTASSAAVSDSTQGNGGETAALPTLQTAEQTISGADSLLLEADRIAAGYDYDRAIELLKASEYFDQDDRINQAIAGYEEIKATLQPYDLTQITHVFFHTLVMDEDKAFDGDEDEKGYNQVMTTKDEFLKILESMYEKGFVLVRLHDMASAVTGEDGSIHMEKGSILLPEGKKAFVMSQDDVCYYEYMTGDGFASRMVIGENGKPTCQMLLVDGTTVEGAFDLVPLLEDFIQEHPDFSYRGARAVIAFTGYQGILGYRTAPSYSDSPTYEQDCQDAAAVAQALRDNGWELASHSWGHRDLGTIDFEKFKTDSDKWENEVESLIGPTDIILFPFGADIGDWHPYTHDNERFNYLQKLGFRYFCNVDSNQHWVQLGSDFLRQGRRNLDGYRMWKDIEAGSDSSKRKLDDLFRAEDVFSSKRPTPVLWE